MKSPLWQTISVPKEVAARRDIRPRQVQAIFEYGAGNAYKDRGRGLYDTLMMTDNWADALRSFDGRMGDSED